MILKVKGKEFQNHGLYPRDPEGIYQFVLWKGCI